MKHTRILIALLFVFPHLVLATTYDCSDKGQCGLPSDGAYQNVVLGTVVDIADKATQEKIFHWAKAHHYWSKLPDDAAAFHEAIQIMAVETPDGNNLKTLTLLMGRKDFSASNIKQGDYVRHTPHPLKQAALPGYANNPKDEYWAVFGCIAVLCSVQDLTCPSRYQSGIYSLEGQPLGDAAVFAQPIDPVTYLPIKTQ